MEATIRKLNRIPSLVGVVGVLYAAGFLIVHEFHESYWIRPIDSELLRLRYLHVGMLYVASLISVVFPVVLELERRAEKKAGTDKTSWKITGPGIIGVTLMIWTFYFTLIFASPGTFLHFQVQIPLILAIAVPFYYGRRALKVQEATKRNGVSDPKEKKAVSQWRWFALTVVALAFTIIVLDRLYDLPELIFRSFWFLLSAALIGFVARRSSMLAETERIARTDGKPVERDLRYRSYFHVIIAFLALFFNLTVFANGLFHYIPATKGGGDFSFNESILVRLDPHLHARLPLQLDDTILKNGTCSKPLILIDATDLSILVADVTDNGGPHNWRRSRSQRPAVWELPRSRGLSIEYYHR